MDEVADPVPGQGQVLVRTLACGICGSDLHFRQHGPRMAQINAEVAGGPPPDPAAFDGIIMGHEFSAEVVEAGPGTEAPAPGTIVTSVPILMGGPTGFTALGFSNAVPGGYSEYMLLSAPMLVAVPNGLDPRLAAFTEPMAVGLHAVNKSGIERGASALVLGCGPVGLSCIAALKGKGIETIVASDFSPARRALATKLGATAVVDPAETSAIEGWREAGGREPLTIYEAVGVPGMLDRAMRDAPRGSRILVVGVCMEADTIHPIVGINKELEIRFALGYDPVREFAPTLTEIAEGRLDVEPLITAEVGLDKVAWAFDALADPEAHCKILVEPGLSV